MAYGYPFPGMTKFQMEHGGKPFTSDVKATPFRRNIVVTDQSTAMTMKKNIL